MGLTRVATWKDAKQGKAILLEVGGVRLEISHVDLGILNTEKKIRKELELQAGTGNVQPPPLFIHVNRDSSVALATGAAPDLWPEDEPDPGDLEPKKKLNNHG